MNIWGWVENDLISPKNKKRKSARNGYPDLTCVRNIKIFNYQLINNLIKFFVFFKTPPKVKKEDPLKIPFKSLEARMKWDSRPKQKQNTTRYAILINKTNRHNSHVARVLAYSSVKGAVRCIFGTSILPNYITVYLYVKKRPFTKAQTQFTCCHIYQVLFRSECSFSTFGVFYYDYDYDYDYYY